jgi:hypothetical protein
MPPVSRRHFLQGIGVASVVAALPRVARAQQAGSSGRAATGRELKCDVLVIGGSLGGIAAALAAARLGSNVVVTEETAWVGGQATTQGVPLDEHPWIEQFGSTRTYRDFRAGVRDYYRRHYPLTAEARADRFLNPGAAWVTALAFEPRVGIAVLNEMLAPHLSSGRVRILTRHRPTAVTMNGDRVAAVTVFDEQRGASRTLTAPYILDATELGELLELGRIEHVIGAESQSETGETNALEGAANPRDQMGFTHLFAMDYLPGEEHVIAKPRDYDLWAKPQASGRSKITVTDLFGAKLNYSGQPVDPNRYVTSSWNFRRLLCRTNFVEGAFKSDVTVPIWGANEYHAGVLLGVSPEERKKHFEGARQLTLSMIYWLQTEAPNPATGGKGFPGIRPRGDVFGTDDGLAQYPYIRESARIKAEFTMLEQHFRNDLPGRQDGPVKYPDSIGVGGYRIDIHKPAKRGAKGSMTQSNHGKHWCQQIALGSLIPVRVENLIPAGKNIGVTAVVNGATRLHPVEWNVGEVAGALAAYCVTKKLAPRQVRNTPQHLADFQRELVRQGVELDWPAGWRQTSRSYFSHHAQEIKDADTFYFGEAWRLKNVPSNR